MPNYPIERDKLLDAAALLAPATVGPGRPPYTAHRRAVSTAYYALFHAINGRVAATVFPATDPAFAQRVRRWISHSDVAQVSRWVAQIGGAAPGGPPQHIVALFATAQEAIETDADVVAIADAFRELHEKREQADYDHTAVFTRPDTLQLINRAREAVALVDSAHSEASDRFFGLIAMQARIVNR